MARGFLLKNNLTKDTLLRIALLGILTVAAVSSPYFLHIAVKGYFKEKTKEMAKKRARKLRELQKRRLIEFKEMSDGSVKIILTHLGKNLVRQYKLEEMKLVKPQKWDKKWRMIIYDIPHRHQKASNAFREKLKQLGLYQLQKSVWVSPYECLAEIEFLCSVFDIDINNHIYYFRTEEIPKEKEIKKFFLI
jgi:DNA-binding transcriptional regulator PaaX